MALTFLFPQLLLPRKSVELGRFITDIEHPHQTHHDPVYSKQPEAIISYQHNFVASTQRDTSSTFASALTALFSTSLSKRAQRRLRVEAVAVTTYTLSNSDEWFKEAVELTGTKSWYERSVDKGYNVYMIVGFHTITDATISQERLRENEVGAELSVPVGLSLATIGAILRLGEIIDPAVGRSTQTLSNRQATFTAPGEQVCAFQYRKIKHSWLSSKTIDASRLSKIHWYSVESSRDDEPGEDDIIEVELTSDLDGIEDGWTATKIETGETIFTLTDGDGATV